MLVRLLYASRSSQAVDADFVRAILETSRSANQAHGITGILCSYARGGVFLQALEGGRDAVNRLYGNIVRDARHEDVTLLEYAEVDHRLFGGWRMGAVDLGKVNVSAVLRYSEQPALDPFSMSAASALALLEELASSAAVASREQA